MCVCARVCGFRLRAVINVFVFLLGARMFCLLVYVCYTMFLLLLFRRELFVALALPASLLRVRFVSCFILACAVLRPFPFLLVSVRTFKLVPCSGCVKVLTVSASDKGFPKGGVCEGEVNNWGCVRTGCNNLFCINPCENLRV